jgi:hypothetical protein
MISEATNQEELTDQQGRVISGSSHHCPGCKTVGRVFHSHPRGLGERFALMIAPKHGIYRCHDCNWRGWQVRSKSSPIAAWSVLILNILLILGVIAVGVYFLVNGIEHPRHMP